MVTKQVLRHASRRGHASSRGPTLLHGPSFETLARFSYTLLCVCVDRVDYSVAHTLLQLTGNYFQVGAFPLVCVFVCFFCEFCEFCEFFHFVCFFSVSLSKHVYLA